MIIKENDINNEEADFMYIAKKYAQSLDDTIDEVVGFGVNGEAFLTVKGKIIKITRSEQEAIAVKKLINKKAEKYVLKYYDVKKLVLSNSEKQRGDYQYLSKLYIERGLSDRVYGIYMDYVKALSKTDEKIINKYIHIMQPDNIKKTKRIDIFLEIIEDDFDNFFDGLFNLLNLDIDKKDLKKYFLENIFNIYYKSDPVFNYTKMLDVIDNYLLLSSSKEIDIFDIKTAKEQINNKSEIIKYINNNFNNKFNKLNQEKRFEIYNKPKVSDLLNKLKKHSDAIRKSDLYDKKNTNIIQLIDFDNDNLNKAITIISKLFNMQRYIKKVYDINNTDLHGGNIGVSSDGFIVFDIMEAYEEGQKGFDGNILQIENKKVLKEVLINEEQKSLILYHGSPYLFKDFKTSELTFFSETEKFAIEYAEQKSMDYAMDRDPKLYKVKVNGNIFDSTNKTELKNLYKKLPEQIKYTYNNFGFDDTVDKDEFINLLQGIDYYEPPKELLNVKVGEEYQSANDYNEYYKILHKDNDYAYGYRLKNFQFIKDNMFEMSPRVMRDEIKTYFKDLREYVLEYAKRMREAYYNDSILKYIFELAMIDNNEQGYLSQPLSDDFKKGVKDLYKKSYKNFMSDLIKNKDTKLRKFGLKRVPVDIDTWRFYENETTISILKEFGYDGYVAKERGVPTYGIFNLDIVDIIEYQIPYGLKFKTLEEYKKYQQYTKEIYEKSKEMGYEPFTIERYDYYKAFKQNKSVDEFINVFFKE